MTKDKIPGILSDPWRRSSTPAKSVHLPEPEPEPDLDPSPVNDDIQDDAQHSTIELKGYGGITVDGVSKLGHAAAQVLQFCVDNHTKIDSTLLKYGVLVAKVPVTPLKLQFYVQRQDGWLLAVPEAQTRDEGCLQLIQAMMEIYRDSFLRQVLTKYRIRPYKM